MNPNALTRNKFVDKLLKIVPENPISQSQYIYYLSAIIFLGLFGFAITSWVELFRFFSFQTMFRGVFMTAISLMSLYGLKSARNAYHTVRELYKSIPNQDEINTIAKMNVESTEEMLEAFKQ